MDINQLFLKLFILHGIIITECNNLNKICFNQTSFDMIIIPTKLVSFPETLCVLHQEVAYSPMVVRISIPPSL